jgi:hypothetical protein
MFKWISDSYAEVFDLVLLGRVQQNRRRAGSKSVYRPVVRSSWKKRSQAAE